MEIYVHIPFCKQKCRYCSFISQVGSKTDYEDYITLLLKEAETRKEEINETISTVYIGGGTPSLLPPDQLKRLVNGLRKIFDFSHLVEFTSEANPGTLTKEWLMAATDSGINRLSIGMQAFQNQMLSFLGRIHCFEDVVHSVSLARESGIGNINLDLLFGIPGQTSVDWSETLDAALSLHPEHISAYGLIPEEGTPLYRDLEKHLYELPDPDTERKMYDEAIVKLNRKGLFQYEISNFARQGFECKHNIGYWTQIPYMGIGVSAASMTGLSAGMNGMTYIRRTNPETMQEYSRLIAAGALPGSIERINPAEARFETMMLGLRMNKGVDGNVFYRMHGISVEKSFGNRLTDLQNKGLILHQGGNWKLTRRGFDIQNSILVELMDDPVS